MASPFLVHGASQAPLRNADLAPLLGFFNYFRFSVNYAVGFSCVSGNTAKLLAMQTPTGLGQIHLPPAGCSSQSATPPCLASEFRFPSFCRPAFFWVPTPSSRKENDVGPTILPFFFDPRSLSSPLPQYSRRDPPTLSSIPSSG